MSNRRSTPWNDHVRCGLCSRQLIPVSFTRWSMDDGANGLASRPDLKCPGCGQCYQWEDSAHWVPVHPVRVPVRIVPLHLLDSDLDPTSTNRTAAGQIGPRFRRLGESRRCDSTNAQGELPRRLWPPAGAPNVLSRFDMAACPARPQCAGSVARPPR
jgi:hypothetical protein